MIFHFELFIQLIKNNFYLKSKGHCSMADRLESTSIEWKDIQLLALKKRKEHLCTYTKDIHGHTHVKTIIL